MSTLVFTAVGAAYGGPWGAAIGSMVGGFIDTAFIFPALFPTDRPEAQGAIGPRLDLMNLQTASEGSPINYCIGPGTRMTGTLIWISDIWTNVIYEEVGGGGGGGKGGGSDEDYGGGVIAHYHHYVGLACAICEGEIDHVNKIWADGKLIYDRTGSGMAAGVCTNYTIYNGTTTQSPNSYIEAATGEDAPGFRGIAYIVFEALYINPWGNRIPQFSFEVEADTTMTVSGALDAILERAGIGSDERDTSGVSGDFKGMIVPGLQSARRLLEPIVIAYDLQTRETNGKLVFEQRDNLRAVTVNADDLAAHEGSAEETTRPAMLADQMSVDFPEKVTIQYLDIENDYQQGSQVETRIDAPRGTAISMSLPLSLDSAAARTIAMRELWYPWLNRQVVQFSLPPSYFYLRPNDIISTTIFDNALELMVRRIDRGNNGVVAVEAVVLVTGASYDGDGDSPPPPDDDVYTPPEVFLAIMDLGPLNDAHSLNAGYYSCCCADDIDAMWKGAGLYASGDQTNYALVGSHPAESKMGTLSGTLAAGPVGYWDRVHVATVVMKHGALESKSEALVLAGENWCLIGEEIIGFQNATLVDTNTYELDTLLRGLRGSDAETLTHADGERFVCLNSGGVLFRPINLAVVDTPRRFKGVAFADDIDTVDYQDVTLEGQNLMPFSVCEVHGTRDGSNNLTITWIRRTRAIINVFGAPGAPLLEAAEEYEIDIWSGSAVLRTLTSTTPTTTYTAAQQTADGLTPGDPVTVRIYQMSASVGRGHMKEATV